MGPDGPWRAPRWGKRDSDREQPDNGSCGPLSREGHGPGVGLLQLPAACEQSALGFHPAGCGGFAGGSGSVGGVKFLIRAAVACPLPGVSLPAPSPHSGESEQLHKHRAGRPLRCEMPSVQRPNTPCLRPMDAFLGNMCVHSTCESVVSAAGGGGFLHACACIWHINTLGVQLYVWNKC